MHHASRFFVFYTKQKINLTWPDYPLRFINSVVKQSSQKSSGMVDFIIPPTLFEIPKKVVLHGVDVLH